MQTHARMVSDYGIVAELLKCMMCLCVCNVCVCSNYAVLNVPAHLSVLSLIEEKIGLTIRCGRFLLGDNAGLQIIECDPTRSNLIIANTRIVTFINLLTVMHHQCPQCIHRS